jgi:uncharacterized membrane protein
MQTPASVKNHPYHPILVALPIGLWVFSLFSDILAYFHWGGPAWASVAYFTLAGGIVTALIAAVPGFIDLLSITEKKLRQIGIFHMIINLVVVALYVVNLFLRRNGAGGPSPIILSAIGVILLGISGWLGGELVHHYGITVAERGREGGTQAG